MERFAELISNQLQLAARQGEFLRFEQARIENKSLESQIAALRLKILHQRQELNILVDGV
jgi:hypothetical protein